MSPRIQGYGHNIACCAEIRGLTACGPDHFSLERISPRRHDAVPAHEPYHPFMFYFCLVQLCFDMGQIVHILFHQLQSPGFMACDPPKRFHPVPGLVQGFCVIDKNLHPGGFCIPNNPAVKRGGNKQIRMHFFDMGIGRIEKPTHNRSFV